MSPNTRFAALYDRWKANPSLRGVRISPGNRDGIPAVLYVRATVKPDDRQNSEHIHVHDPATGKLIYRTVKLDDPRAVGETVLELLGHTADA